VLIVAMVVVGGFVRLSRAGLSLVEWDVVTGVIPPIGEAAWSDAFADYQQTPEYLLVNEGMSLSEFKRIFYYEWGHRLIARLAGLAVIVPIIFFMAKGKLSKRQSLRYWGIAALFAAQGALGWIMVSSGLRDRPAVSEFRLTIHLLAALLLLALVLWMAMNRLATERGQPTSPVGRSRSLTLGWVLLGAVVVQIAFGGLVAGLKAGLVSNTWPLMYGDLAPSSAFDGADSWWRSLLEPVGSHWVHRWFAFVVLGVAVAVIARLRSTHRSTPTLQTAAAWLLGVIVGQVALGVWVVLTNVPKWLALAHQANGVIVFIVSLVIVHQVRSRSEEAVPVAV
jgi:cytochrome c oxidase assembly protein subunit 15